jgi:hypothetical protein
MDHQPKKKRSKRNPPPFKNMLAMLISMLLGIKIQNGVVYKIELENMLHQAQNHLSALEIVQGGQACTPPMTMMSGTFLNDLFPSLVHLFEQHAANPAELRRLIKLTKHQINQLKASLKLWDLLEYLIQSFQRNNDRGGGGGGGGVAEGIVRI